MERGYDGVGSEHAMETSGASVDGTARTNLLLVQPTSVAQFMVQNAEATATAEKIDGEAVRGTVEDV